MRLLEYKSGGSIMLFKMLVSIAICLMFSGVAAFAQQYDTIRWDTLKDYQAPGWFQDAKLGIYPHHEATYGDPGTFGYKDLIPLFKAENFNADTLMSYVANAGAKYFAHLTSHHDAFLMYGSKLSRWNCVNM